MIKPSIGRVVWFWESAMAAQRENAQPNAAIVTFVHNDELVNLTVFSAVGYPGAYTHIPLWQGEGERPQGMHCEWMPYQKGQAAKVEAIEAAAKLQGGPTLTVPVPFVPPLPPIA